MEPLTNNSWLVLVYIQKCSESLNAAGGHGVDLKLSSPRQDFVFKLRSELTDLDLLVSLLCD